MATTPRSVVELLSDYVPRDPGEAADVARIRALVETVTDPWSREIPLHVTASALVVHAASERVLLRWHQRQQAWLHIGGHGDPGETDPLAVVLREGREETGLVDLAPWPRPALVHVVIVPVPAKGDEPAHEHADLRFVLATNDPDSVRPEKPGALVRWLSFAEARAATTEENLRETLSRVEGLVAR